MKDWLQALAWLAAAAGVIVTVAKFWSELRLGRQQRERDLFWKQAEAGKKLNDEMLHGRKAWSAMQMLDYSGREFELPSQDRVTITHDEVRRALDPATLVKDPKDIYIRDCFDSLFYHMSIIENYITSTLIRPEDVAYPLEYYVPLLTKFQPEADRYLQRFGMVRAQRFLSRTEFRRGQRTRPNDCSSGRALGAAGELEPAGKVGSKHHGLK